MPTQRNQLNKILNILIAAGALGSVSVSLHANAQGASSGPTAATSPQKVEKIEVTGSNLKRVDAETSQPITVITSEEIQRSGATTVQELLANLSVNSGSALTDATAGNGFSTGSATVALRGLGSAATLTLLNGRRLSPAAFNDPNNGNTNLVNLNSIPAAAIERIEILRDGASAVYGSDAMAGVVNIILRKDFTGATISGTFSQNPDNEFRVWQANASFGFGDLAKDKYNVFGTYERFQRTPVLIRSEDNVDQLWQNTVVNQRQTVLSSLSYPGNYYREATLGSGVFGTFVAARPGCAQVVATLCRYNQWDDLEQTGKSVRDTGYVRGSIEFSSNLSGFAEAGFSRTVSTFTGAPPSSNPQAATVWRNPANQLLRFQLVLPVGHRENPYTFPVGLRYRWVDLGRSQDIATTEELRLLTGLRGTAWAWDWESAFLYNKNTSEADSGRRLLFPAVQTAINDGSWVFNGTNSQALIDRISARTTDRGESSSKLFDIKASREFGSLSGGAIGVAVGAEFRRDTMVVTPDARLTRGEIVGLGASFANGSRSVTSAYTEVGLPVSKTLELNVAGRYDRYSDFGSTSNPKVGLKWKPLPNFIARASYSSAFRAPTLPQTSPAAIRSFQAVNDPIRCPVTNTNEDCGRIGSVSAAILFNPNIKPETSDGRTLGFVWDAAKDLSITVDYFDIRRKNEIDRFSSNFQVNALFNGDQRFAPFVFRDTNPLSWIPGVANSGPVIGVNRAWLNLGKSQVTGIDFDVTNRLGLGEWGSLRTTLTGTYNLRNTQTREAADTATNFVGGINTSVTGRAAPRFRGNLDTTWRYRDWSFGGRINYLSGWNNFSSALPCIGNFSAATVAAIPDSCIVKPWHTVDINATYTGIKNLTLRLVVRNLQDKKPPYDGNGGDLTAGYNLGFHNPLGIYPSLSATYRFK